MDVTSEGGRTYNSRAAERVKDVPTKDVPTKDVPFKRCDRIKDVTINPKGYESKDKSMSETKPDVDPEQDC